MRASADAATITHREFVGDITGTALFALSKHVINPGMPGLFPWLSKIAINYETYNFTKLQFHYETAVSTTTSGSILMAVDYDAGDADPLDKRQLMSYAHAVRSAAWQEDTYSCHVADLSKFVKERYVRKEEEKGDIKTYDVGNFFIATQGTPAAEMGELYVSYTVVLRTPQSAGVAPSAAPTSPLAAQFHMTVPENVPAVASWLVPYLGVTFNSASILQVGSNFYLPPGDYEFSVNFLCTAGPISAFRIEKNGSLLVPDRVSTAVASTPAEMSGIITSTDVADAWYIRVMSVGAVILPAWSNTVSFKLL
jgi:hypothetical protein